MSAEPQDLDALRRELYLAREERDLCRALLLMDHATAQHFRREVRGVVERLPAQLKQPAREPEAFRVKLQRLLDEMTRLGDVATELALPTLAEQIEAARATLESVHAQAQPTGDDFLPVIPLLDAVLTTLSIVCPPETIHIAGTDAVANDDSGGTAAVTQSRLEQALQQLTDQLAAEHRKQLRLKASGLETVPEDWHSTIFDVASQLLRNAIEHGIEAPEQRRTAGKTECGTLELEFALRPEGGELVLRDDGQGLDAERILDAGVALGFVADDPAARDARRAAGLIFRPGLTTAHKPDGRGHGMHIVRDQIRRLGGQIQISTKKGRYTSVRAELPKPPTA
jgi:chemotaxis protein histidine kinase CheA